MRRMPLGAALTFVVPVLFAGCALSLDGYEGPPVADDAAPDTQMDAASSAEADVETKPDDASDAADEEGQVLPPRPIVFVQATASFTQSAVTSFSVPYVAPVADHDTLIAAIYVSSTANLTGVTDTLGNTFQILCNQTVPAYGLDVYVVAAYDISGGALDTVTLHSTTSTMTNLLIHEYANVAPGNGCTHALGSGTAVDGIVSPPLTLDVPNEMIFAYAVSGIVAPGTGFTTRSTFDGDLTEDRIVPEPGMASALATVMQAGPQWDIVAADFKPR